MTRPGLKRLTRDPADIHALIGIDPADVDHITDVTDPLLSRTQDPVVAVRPMRLSVLTDEVTEALRVNVFGIHGQQPPVARTAKHWLVARAVRCGSRA